MKVFKSILIILLISNCSTKKKSKEWNDPAWRIQSLKSISSMCKKISNCSQNIITSISKKYHSHIKNEMREDRCIEKYKKSNIYHLRGKEPLKQKKIAIDCFAHIKTLTCEQIKAGKIYQSSSCQKMRDLQKLSFK